MKREVVGKGVEEGWGGRGSDLPAWNIEYALEYANHAPNVT